jgi:hypothetical protein
MPGELQRENDRPNTYECSISRQCFLRGGGREPAGQTEPNGMMGACLAFHGAKECAEIKKESCRP